MKRYLKRSLFYQREIIIKALNQRYELPAPQRIVIALTHVVSPEEASRRELGATKLDRLTRSIDGILMSFAADEIELNVCTATGRNLLAELPDYQRKYVNIRTFDECNPMHIEFRAHDVLAERVEVADWFLFIEDDIVINDPFILRKLAAFNAAIQDPSIVLNPHRYEYFKGRKSYIDLTICTRIDWDKTTQFEFNGNLFAECSNSHAAMFVLNRQQLQRWIRLGRTWHDETVGVGPLETAATFSLMEHFQFYKPAPPNLAYFEVQHYGSKYSRPVAEMAEIARPFSMSASHLVVQPSNQTGEE